MCYTSTITPIAVTPKEKIEMLLNLDLESEVPIYQQIKTQIIEGIANGRIKPGETLPSVRQLAADIGINLHTVNKAYHLLRDAGVVVIHRQRGVVIVDRPEPPNRENYLRTLSERLREIAAEAKMFSISRDNFQRIAGEAYDELHHNPQSTNHNPQITP